VVLGDATHEDVVPGIASELTARHNGRRHQVYGKALKGFVAELSPAAAVALSNDSRVEFVEEDTLAYAAAIQTSAPWGLDRIDQRRSAPDGIYRYDSDGRGVHMYIIDSGVRISHAEFAPLGRATKDFGRYGLDDCYGHGTGVASVAGGIRTGVAKAAFIHSVRVLDCSGTAPWSDIIEGIDWVAANHRKPAVANMSIGGGGTFSSVERAIQGAIDAGVTFVAAAGNNFVDACTMTPGFVTSAVIVGNADAADRRYFSSNYGACVDLFAPGSGISGASFTSDSGFSTFTGTSMSAPLVAGAAALYLQRRPTAPPAEVVDAIVDSATPGELIELNGSPNLLLYTRAVGDSVPPTVSLTAPAAGSTVSGTVDVAAAATDNLEVAAVEFYAGGTLITIDHTAPYAARWVTNALAPGSYSLTAVAIDSGGNATTSAARTVRVTNPDTRSAFAAIEAEAYDAMSGIVKNPTYIGYADGGDWVKYGGIDFGAGADAVSVYVAVAPGYAGKSIQFRLDSTTGPIIGALDVASTGGWQTYITQTTAITGASGVHDLFLVFAGGDGVGNIDLLQFRSGGASRSALVRREAEAFDSMSGVVKKPTYIGYLDGGDWVRYRALDFGRGANAASIRVAVAPGYAGKSIQLRLDSTTGPRIGTLTVASTGGWHTFVTQSVAIGGASGVHDLYLVFAGGAAVGNVDWLQFHGTRELATTGWSASASASASYAPASRAIDRNPTFKWQNGRSQATSNDYIQVDLGSARMFNRIVLEHTGNLNDYPVAYALTVSDDGKTWTTVKTGAGTRTATTISLPDKHTKRYLRVTETGSVGGYWFTVNELRVFID
jgi:subtilisin family serine protease